MSTMLASDDNNPQFMGASNPDAVLYVKFFDKPVQNQFESMKQGRPIMEMKTFKRIEKPGDLLSVIETFAYAADFKRFPMHYQHYLNAKEKGVEGMSGTMLADWPLLTAAQAEELRHFKFYTVEQVAGASDLQLQSIGMIAGMAGTSFRDKAKQFLMAAHDSAGVSAQAEALAKAKADMDAANQKIAELNAKVEALLSVAGTSIAPPQAQKRTRRTKAEMEVDRLAALSPAPPVVQEQATEQI